MWCQCARETCCDGLRGRHRRGQPPITPDVLDPCGDAWRRPSPSVALSAELSNNSGFSSSIVRTGTVALSDHGCRLGEPVRLVHQ